MILSNAYDETILEELFPGSDHYHIKMSLLLANFKRRSDRLVEEITSGTSDIIVNNEIGLVREALKEIEATLAEKE